MIVRSRSELVFFEAMGASGLLDRVRAQGFSFVPQHPFGKYRIDFACFHADGRRLAIEIDGASHKRLARQDAARDSLLRKYGWSVLRVGASIDPDDYDVSTVVAEIGQLQSGSTDSLRRHILRYADEIRARGHHPGSVATDVHATWKFFSLKDIDDFEIFALRFEHACSISRDWSFDFLGDRRQYVCSCLWCREGDIGPLVRRLFVTSVEDHVALYSGLDESLPWYVTIRTSSEAVRIHRFQNKRLALDYLVESRALYLCACKDRAKMYPCLEHEGLVLPLRPSFDVEADWRIWRDARLEGELVDLHTYVLTVYGSRARSSP